MARLFLLIALSYQFRSDRRSQNQNPENDRDPGHRQDARGKKDQSTQEPEGPNLRTIPQ